MSLTIREVPDGGFGYPREAILPAAVGEDPIAQYPAIVPIPYRPILADAGGKLVLFDTGAGPLAPSTGQLQASLHGLQVKPEMIEVVLLSHAHADHIGGLIDREGQPAFPNARILISRDEYEFWRHSGFRERLGSGSVYGNAAIESAIDYWFDQYLIPVEQRLEFWEGETEPLRGITAIPAPGHTPGHSAFLIDGAPEPVLFTGDAFTLPEHIAHPEWVSCFDLDAARTSETRLRLLDRAATDKCRVVHYHIGAIGRVGRQGSGYVWEPEFDAPVA
jgi:glyoxylase-like metal-dependent hydrolase (beta-lactamase superfamily II)